MALEPEAYALLKLAKRPDETFSDAVKRLARPRKPLSEFAGIWADAPSADLKAVLGLRAESKRKAKERIRRLTGRSGART